MPQVINFDLSHYKLERPFLADTVEKLQIFQPVKTICDITFL